MSGAVRARAGSARVAALVRLVTVRLCGGRGPGEDGRRAAL